MIEFSMNGTDHWVKINNARSPTDYYFFDYKIRINDKIFTSRTPEFISAFKKVKFWEKISAK